MTENSSQESAAETREDKAAWAALWAMVIGFFMILVDTTIVSVANPAIKAALDPRTPDLEKVVWVTSAYLLAYAVPSLVTGRLGDRYGPKTIYLTGLTVFTLSSLACGLSGSLGMLICFRAIQGIGASCMTPQTMAIITRTFPANRRGAAMGLWGATSGVAMLVGPVAGGMIVDAFGWEWVFFINVPVGIVGLILAVKLVPTLPRSISRLDLFGVLLSGVALFLIVFPLQEANTYSWGTIWGPFSVWSLMGIGVLTLVGFFVWQSKTQKQPLIPLGLFRERNFSAANLAILTVGFAITGMTVPFMFFFQTARMLSPMQSGLMMVPMALVGGILAPFAGRKLDQTNPKSIIVPGVLIVALSLGIYAGLMSTSTPIWMFLLPSFLMGIGQAGVWGPLATTASRNLSPRDAGAGSSVYNTTRTLGNVLGSATIAAFMQMRLNANLPGVSELPVGVLSGSARMPDQIISGFARSMSQTIMLTALVLLVGVVAGLSLRDPRRKAPVAMSAPSGSLEP